MDQQAKPAAGGRPDVRLTLYSRTYCHLCHDMEALLRELAAECPFQLDIVDIDADPALEERFNELVPVLMQGGQELARYHLDSTALRLHLERQYSQR